MKYYCGFVFLILIAAPAYASALYVNIGVGGVRSSSSTSFGDNSSSALYGSTSLGTSLFNLPNVNFKNDFDNGFNTSIALGDKLTPNLRGEIEFLYQNLNRNISGSYNWQEINTATQAVYAKSYGNPVSKSSSRVSIYSFMTNGYYDFKNTSPWTPFLGGGFGVAWLTSASTNTMNVLNVDDPATPLIESAPVLQHSPSLYGTVFAWQLKAGCSYHFNKGDELIMQYRLFSTSDLHAGRSYITSNPNTSVATQFNVGENEISGILTHALEINYRFNL